MKLNLGMGSGAGASGGNDAIKNAEIIFEDADLRVMKYKGATYWRFYVYCHSRLPFPDPKHENHKSKRFGREFFNQQDAQKHFNSIRTSNNIITLPTK